MNPALTPDELLLLREALIALRRQHDVVTTFGSRFLQGTAQTSLLVKAGERLRDIDALDYRLREAHAQATGMPAIQHGNTDLASEPGIQLMTRADEAREANARG